MVDIQSPTAEVRRGKTKKKEEERNRTKLECGPMPKVMVALPHIDGAQCSTPQSLADATSGLPCSNAAKTRKPLKLAGVPQTTGTISAASGPKFVILWRHLEVILRLNTFFPTVDTYLGCEDIARQNCAMVPGWRFLTTFLRPVSQQATCSTFQTCILNSH